MIVPIVSFATLTFWLAAPTVDYRLPGDPADPLGNPVHFWLIALAGLLALLLALLMNGAARRRDDARVQLIALGMLNAAAAILLHALSTPNVLISGRNIGFVISAPIGVVMAAVFFAAGALELRPAAALRVVRANGLLQGLSLGFWAIFTGTALLSLPPLDQVPDPAVIDTPLFFCLVGELPSPVVQWSATVVLSAAAGLFVFAAVQHLSRLRRTPAALGWTMAGACLLLALIALNVGLARTWRLSWWQWHLLLTVAFAMLGYSVYRQYRREGSARPIFDSLYLEETTARIREEYSGALETLVADLQQRIDNPDAAGPAVSAKVAERFNLSEGQTAVLERAAGALVHEREQIERLGALVAISRESSVIQAELQLLQQALGMAATAFRRDTFRIGLIREGRLDYAGGLQIGPNPVRDPAQRTRLIGTVMRERRPVEEAGISVLPLLVKGRPVGVIEVSRSNGAFAEHDRHLLQAFAGQLSVALENARLYHQIDALFHQYMPESVATALIADPSQAALGGAVREISVLFGDLRGFTTLSERLSPPALVDLLNRYYAAASQAVLAEGGTIDKFMGDALMALFNAPAQQSDHALRACRAALTMQQAIAPIAAEAPICPVSGSASIPARRWSAISVVNDCATSPRSATRSIWPRACNRGPKAARF
ncbi:MAG: GAF domain-containing protein [Oscillochloris sp.]|nr:GAF domain-containing protein [Oscillochloris sp.]